MVKKREKQNNLPPKKLEVRSPENEKFLPRNWVLSKFDDVANATDYVANGSFASLRENVNYKNEPDYAVLVRLTDFTNNWRGKFVYVDKHAYDFLSKSYLEPGDVVIANVGDPGRVFRVPNLGQPMTIGPNSVLVRPYCEISKGFIFYFFMSPWGKDLISQIVTGTAQKKFNKTGLRALYIPLAPLNEQKLIVAEIEKQFSRLDEAVENLKRVKANLKRYKASVLKAAVEGKLTEQWRAKNPDVEPTSQLLERILKERRKKWEENELAKMVAKGREPKDNKWKGRYKESEPLGTSILPKLPSKWVWARIADIGKIQLGRQRAPKYHSGPNMRPYLRVQNVFEDKIDLSDVMEMDFPPEDYEKYKLEIDDILLNEGQSPEFLGRPALYRGELPGACFTNTLLRLQVSPLLKPDYSLLVFRAYMRSKRFTKEGTITTNIAHLSAGRFSKIEYPLPPLEEQEEIVKESQKMLSIVDALDHEVDRGLVRAARLRQSILKKAFTGKLLSISKEYEDNCTIELPIAAEVTENYGNKGGFRKFFKR